jgi:hypothetical protein
MTGSNCVWITLLEKRIAWLRGLARQRRNNAVRLELSGRNAAPTEYDEALELDDVGVCGECAAMIFLSPVNWNLMEMERADFNDLVDVKTNRRRYPINYLIVRPPKDPKEWIYALAFPDPHPRYCLAGWCFGHEAQQSQFWGSLNPHRPPVFNVPITAPVMRSMHALRVYLQGEGAR